MKAAIKKKTKEIICIERKRPEIKNAEEAMVKILYASICGSDINRIASMDKKWDNLIPGHEAVGEIVKLGDKVKNFNIGDKVAIIPLVPCFSCVMCVQGNYEFCTNYKFIGTRLNGAFVEYIAINSRNLFKIPNEKDVEKYVFLEPLSVAIHSINKAGINFGKTAAIIGSGTIGLLIFSILNNLLAYEVATADIDNYKLKIAKEIGAKYCVNINEENLEDFIKTNINTDGVDITFESSGAAEAKSLSIIITKPRGKIVILGTSNEDLSFKRSIFELIVRKEQTVIGSWMSYSYPFPGLEWQSAFKILNNNIIDIKYLITHRFKIDDIKSAFDMIYENKQSFCKIIIDF